MTNTFWDGIRKFKSYEFDSPNSPGSGINMSRDLVEILDAMRGKIGLPLIITSGYRTKEDNERVGGVPASAHTRGLAVDVQCLTSSLRFTLIKLAISNGIKRIGVGKDFIHLDLDPDLPQGVCWLYGEKQG